MNEYDQVLRWWSGPYSKNENPPVLERNVVMQYHLLFLLAVSLPVLQTGVQESQYQGIRLMESHIWSHIGNHVASCSGSTLGAILEAVLEATF